MNKKGIMILSSALCLASLGVTAFSSMSNSKLLYADSPKTNAQYAITDWELIDYKGNFDYESEVCAGLFFSPKSGRTDVVLGILVQADDRSCGESLPYSHEPTYCWKLQSTRTWYWDSTQHHYSYQSEIDQKKCFEVRKLFYVIGTKTQDGYTLTKPENFNVTLLSVYTWYAYCYLDAPGQSSTDVNDYHECHEGLQRVFTEEKQYYDDIDNSHGTDGYCKCTGFKVDYSKIQLTYSCSY